MVIDSAVRSFVRRMALCRSCAVHAPWGRESLAQAFRRLQSPRRARIARSDRGRRRPPCGAGRPIDHLDGRAGPACGAGHARRARCPRRPARRVHPPARQVPADRPRTRRDRVQSDADRSLPAGCPGRQDSGQDGGRAGVRAALRRTGRCGRLDGGRRLAAGGRRARRGALSGPDPDGQDLPATGRRRAADRRDSARASRVPTPTTRR